MEYPFQKNYRWELIVWKTRRNNLKKLWEQ